MKLSRLQRWMIALGSMGIVAAGVWLIMVFTKAEAPLRPWRSLFPAATKPSSIVAMPAPRTVETVKSVQPPEVSVGATAPLQTSASSPAPVAGAVAFQPESAAPVGEPGTPGASAPATPATPVSLAEQQIVGTHRMYLAHAPLRAAEIADPDSASNRRILQRMVSKALLRSAQPSIATSVKP